jgi:hypothetical protein
MAATDLVWLLLKISLTSTEEKSGLSLPWKKEVHSILQFLDFDTKKPFSSI